MSIKEQAKYNSALSEKLANYLGKTPKESKNLPENAAFVTFSEKNTRLNKLNDKIVKSLVQQGKTVYKAKQTSDLEQPWVFEKVLPHTI